MPADSSFQTFKTMWSMWSMRFLWLKKDLVGYLKPQLSVSVLSQLTLVSTWHSYAGGESFWTSIPWVAPTAATGRAFSAVTKWIFVLLCAIFMVSPFGRQVCGKKIRNLYLKASRSVNFGLQINFDRKDLKG